MPVVASLVPSLTEEIKKPWIKAVVTAAGIGTVMVGGTFLYKGTGGSFGKAENAAKLPDYVVQIADRLLELDEHPRVIAQDPIGVYIRQYTGEIDQLFGRDILNAHINTPSYEAWVAHRALSDPEADNKEVAQLMLDDGFDYLVFQGDPGQQFELIEYAADYGIYRAIGNPSVVKKRNELGQIISITTVDEYGEPRTTASGYATVEREYDDEGYVSIEKFCNCDESPVITSNGYAEVHRIYDNRGCVIKEQYYGTDGLPMIQPAGNAAIEQEFDDSGRIVSRTYLDADGNPMDRIDGYAKVMWGTVDGLTIQEFYKADGSRIEDIEGINLAKDIRSFPDGWSEWVTPEFDTENCCFVLGTANLGQKSVGDIYTCQLEIEFKDVKVTEGREFRFASQGRGDGSWKNGSIWNSKLVWEGKPLQDGVYEFSNTVGIDDSIVNVNSFELGFRCDYWGSGSFRVKNIKIEKGEASNKCSPGV